MMFAVTELPELTTLFRAVLEAKFHEHPEDEDLAASSLLAETAVRLRDCLRQVEIQEDGSSAEQRWNEWLAITPLRREWRVAMAYASKMWSSGWSSWTDETRDAAVRQLLSPFEVSDSIVAAFSKELEQRNQQS